VGRPTPEQEVGRPVSSVEDPPRASEQPEQAAASSAHESYSPPAPVVATPGGGEHPLRRKIVLGVLISVGVLAAFLSYELWFSGLLESRSQAALLRQFKASLLLDDTNALKTPPEGAPVGVYQIPRINGEQVIVQGIGSDDTKKGPGHDPSTPAPGQAGNVVIVGRQLSYGGPFRHLGSLAPGDSIIVTTRQGQFTYTVTSSATTSLGDPRPVARTTDSRMTLITADPGFGWSNEHVVVAKLTGQGLQAPGPLPLRPPGVAPGKSTELNGRWGPILLWGELFAIVLCVAIYLYRRRWNRAVTYLLTTPLLIALAVLFFRAVDTLLPPTL
jgi:sortase A